MYSSGAVDQLLAAAPQPTILAEGGADGTLNLDQDQTASVNVVFGQGIVDFFNKFGIFCAVVWVAYAIFKFCMPSNRGASGLQRIGGLSPLLIAVTIFFVCLDINRTVDVINLALTAGSWVWSALKGILPGN